MFLRTFGIYCQGMCDNLVMMFTFLGIVISRLLSLILDVSSVVSVSQYRGLVHFIDFCLLSISDSTRPIFLRFFKLSNFGFMSVTPEHQKSGDNSGRVTLR